MSRPAVCPSAEKWEKSRFVLAARRTFCYLVTWSDCSKEKWAGSSGIVIAGFGMAGESYEARSGATSSR
jgi:hypothetical protein